jgi:predicted nuclease of predicted toxin-antitoxin system
VKVLLDECIDWRLLRELTPHEVKTARQMGWSAVKNGELLNLAEKAFDVFVTVDSNLSSQQHLRSFDIGVVVLRARSNRLADLQLLLTPRLEAIPSAKPGTVTVVGAVRQ